MFGVYRQCCTSATCAECYHVPLERVEVLQAIVEDRDEASRIAQAWDQAGYGPVDIVEREED